MKFIIEIDCDNSAFCDCEADEVTRIIKTDIIPALKNERIYKPGDYVRLWDANGNNVGRAKFEEE